MRNTTLRRLKHRDCTVNQTLLTSESSQQKNRGILNTTRGIICEDTDFSHWKNQAGAKTMTLPTMVITTVGNVPLARFQLKYYII